MTIESRLEDVRLAGVAMQAVAENLGYPHGEAWDMQLAVVEALNNSVKHAYRQESGHEIILDLSFLPDGMEVVIRDSGLAMGDLEVRKLEFDPGDIASLPEGGMGLFLIQQMVDEMDYHTGKEGNRFRLFKSMKPA